MAKIYQRNKDNPKASKEAQERWWLDYTSNDGIRRRVSVGTHKEADRVLKTIEGDKSRGLLKLADDKSETKISVLIDEYIDETLKNSSNENSFNALRWLKGEIGEIKLRNLTKKIIMAKRDEWLSRRGRNSQSLKGENNHETINN